MLLENHVINLTIHKTRLEEHKKCQVQGTKKDPIALKEKKDKATVDSSLSFEDEIDYLEESNSQRLQDLIQIEGGLEILLKQTKTIQQNAKQEE